jgi:tetratricopeptide (TPR) repeat protein
MSSFDADSPKPSNLSTSGHWQVVRANDLQRKYFESDQENRVESPTSDRTSPGSEALRNPAATSLLSGIRAGGPIGEAAVASGPNQNTGDQNTGDTNNGDTNTGEQEVPAMVLQRRQQLEQQIRTNPTDREPFLELGAIYREEQRPIEAKRVLSQAIELFPEDADLKWEFEEATLARSLQQLREVTELAGRIDTAETDRELARCQRDWACRRIETCQARLDRDPHLHYIRVALGEAMLDADMTEQAIEELEPLLSLDDFSPPAFLLRGKCFLAMKRELDAMADFRACAMRRSVAAFASVSVAFVMRHGRTIKSTAAA